MLNEEIDNNIDHNIPNNNIDHNIPDSNIPDNNISNNIDHDIPDSNIPDKNISNNIDYDIPNIAQVICPDCGQSTVVNLKTVKKPHCNTCGRAFTLPKNEEKQ